LANGYDVIVLGLGIMGGATVARLSNDGHRVLGLDANQRGHHLGASHGSSRIIREAIVESPDYVPLVRRSFDLWRDLETRSAMSLLTMTGRLNIGTPESGCVTGALASARLHDVRHERLNPSEVAARFPGFRLTDDLVAVFEPNAGALAPGACLDAFLGLATAAGADLHFEEPALSWTASASGVTVTTPKASYQAQALVITLRCLDEPAPAGPPPTARDLARRQRLLHAGHAGLLHARPLPGLPLASTGRRLLRLSGHARRGGQARPARHRRALHA
jgi:sarcosine oxidase